MPPARGSDRPNSPGATARSASSRWSSSGAPPAALGEALTDWCAGAGRGPADLSVGIALFVDEMQDIPTGDVSALCPACHELSQRGGPLIVGGGGLPHLPAVLSASKSYSERLFRYARIDRLDRQAADPALVGPAQP